MVITDPNEGAEAAAELMRGKRTIAITGAGLSTDAGLPDYRGKGSTDVPSVDYDQFVCDPVWQRWVWQRNQETWKAVASLKPTAGHLAITRMQHAGLITAVATQNVDDLHTRAEAQNVFELHGNFRSVQCVDCGAISERTRLDERLREVNPDVRDDPDPAHVAILATADRAGAEASKFVTVPCERCGGLLKPAVVFFGESLPGKAMDESFAYAAAADVALVVGTSLAVLTGLWVVRQAWGNNAKLIVINRGPTAIDNYADVRIEAGASETLAALADKLGA